MTNLIFGKKQAYAIAVALFMIPGAQAKPDNSTHGINCSGKACLCSGVDACNTLKATCDQNDGDYTDATDREGVPYGKCDLKQS